MSTSEGLMISAEAELSSSSGLSHFAWSWRHTFDQWEFARTQHKSALIAKQFKIERDTHFYVCFPVLSTTRSSSPWLCVIQTRGFLWFLSFSGICVTRGRPKTSTWTSHVLSQDLFSKIFNLCEKEIKVPVKRQPDSARYTGRKHHAR